MLHRKINLFKSPPLGFGQQQAKKVPAPIKGKEAFKKKFRPPQPKIHPSVLGTIGNTPLIQLSRLCPGNIEVIAKYEGLNPGGSIKDRTGAYAIGSSLREGLISSSTKVVESTSGNQGIGMAMACLLHGLQFTPVIDPKISKINRQMLKLFGAESDEVSEKDEQGGYLGTRRRRVAERVQSDPQAWTFNQYANPKNWEAHYYGTGAEIVHDLDGWHIDYLICATSTCGTLLGISRRLREVYPTLKVVAVDEVGSSLFEGNPGPRFINGMGAGQPVPELALECYSQSEIDQIIRVTAREAVQGCRDLWGIEGIPAGGSSGAVVAALQKLLPTIPPHSRVIAIFPDRGDRYLDTIYNDDWVAKLPN